MGISQQIGASSLIKPGVIDNTAARPASPYEGQVIFQKDTDQMLVWNGSVWVMPNKPAQNPDGLELVTTATCVSGGTAVNGVTTIGTGVSSVTINAFSSTYDDYHIVVSDGPTVSSYGIGMRFTLVGMTSNLWYGSGFYQQSNTTLSQFNNSGTAHTYLGFGETGSYFIKADISSPFLTKQKDTLVRFASGGTSSYHGMYSSHCNSAGSFSSFTIAPEAGTMTGGSIRVYGYRK